MVSKMLSHLQKEKSLNTCIRMFTNCNSNNGDYMLLATCCVLNFNNVTPQLLYNQYQIGEIQITDAAKIIFGLLFHVMNSYYGPRILMVSSTSSLRNSSAKLGVTKDYKLREKTSHYHEMKYFMV